MFALYPAVLAAAPAASPDNTRLRDTRWVLQALDGVAMQGESASPGIHLVLHAASQHVSGFAGCNRIRGRYTQRGTQLALSAVGSTRKACPAPQMQQEQRFIEVLSTADAYRIEGRVLSLMQGEAVRMTLEAANSK